ncbi:MAG TPA: hypothetical protein VFA75_04470 [Nevskia sp.]|nr:hypothetical protein [Nevskia sp.]
MKQLIAATTLGLALACGTVQADGQKDATPAAPAAAANPNAAHGMGGGGTDIHNTAGINKAEGANDQHKAEGANDHPKTGSTANIQH